MKRAMMALAALAFTAGLALAQGLRVVPNEPGPGGLNGPKDCVLAEGGNKKQSMCPRAKYMKVCGAESASQDRRRSCVNG